MIVLYVLSVLTIFQGILTLIDGVRSARYMRRYAEKTLHDPEPARAETIAVFCPCKGVDYEFEKNIRSILDQDFSNFTVYFVVESENDPAYRVLKNIGAGEVLVAGEATDCGQKVHNLRYAVQQVRRDAGIYVFCDSDARYPRNWLGNLTAPLNGPSEVCTGYRWYSVRRFQFSTLLRSAWNASALGILGDHGRNFVWGGSTAIRRDTFDRIGVLQAWQGALSDDYAITRAAQSAGLQIRFVPSCLIPSHGECSFAELLEFTTRQIIITRVYHAKLWAMGLLAQTTFNISFFGLLIAAIWMPSVLSLVLWMTLFALSVVRSAVRIGAVNSVVHDPALPRFYWFYSLASPLVALLYQYNMLCAAFTTTIEWRQIRYNLISPNETQVRRSAVNVSGYSE